MQKLKTKLPDTPGVYIFAKGRKVLYIGKATSLRDRVKSYFSKDLLETRGPGIVKMLEEANSVRHQQTNSVIEALVLEAKLIKKYQPKYNVREKDDKSFNYVVITKEEYPRILIVRGKELADSLSTISEYFGPFTQGTELREALKIVRKIFPYRDKCIPGEGKPCFNRQIGLCPGVCTGEVSKKEYSQTIKLISLFFSGKYSNIRTNIRVLMNKASSAKEFEKAAKYRNQLFALEHINDVALMKRDKSNVISGFRLEAYDVAHISGTSTVGVMTVMVGGELAKSEYKKFKLRGNSANKSDDTGNLREILERRLAHPEWGAPDLIVVDGGTAQRAVAEKLLATRGMRVPVVSVVKDEHHKPRDIMGESKVVKDYHRDILLANGEAHRFAVTYHKKLRDSVK